MEQKEYRNPSLAADAVVIRNAKGFAEILLIKRKNPPYGWALPGGFVDYGEATDVAAIRELEEETTLKGYNAQLLTVASEPSRDPRQHVVSVVYTVDVYPGQEPKAADDAKEIRWFALNELPEMAFDHLEIIENYVNPR